MQRYYKIEPSLFFDSGNTGFGNYNGIIQKINVINKLDLNYIILPNPLEIYKSSFPEEIVFNENKFGSFDDFKNMIYILDKNELSPLIEIDLLKINEIIIWFKNLKDYQKTNKENLISKENENMDKTETFYISDNTYILNLNSHLKEQEEKLFDIFNYFLKLGIKGFVFKNIANEIDLKNELWLNFFKKTYSNIKTLNNEYNVIFETSLKNIKKIKYLKNMVFDEILVSEIDNLNCNNFSKKIKMILKNDLIVNLTYINNVRTINKIFNNYYLNTEISKLLLSIILLAKSKQFIYFGDEIGLNIFNPSASEFSVETFLKDFFKKKNDKLIFTWNSNINAGFSESNTICGIYDENYKLNNYKIQRNEPNSTLHFYKKLISFTNSDNFIKLIKNCNIKISSFLNLLKIKFISLDYSLTLYANFSQVKRNIKRFQTESIIFSNYNFDRNLIKDKNFVNPYEAILIIDNPYFKDEFNW
ncbi:hypothetical protein [Mycoplasma elephantis]|uniref:alpha-amylase family glycosyl hydrolase n=1 Tax=Mycoplasma elephantis TaxID=114882 RepID=UPI0012EC7827|nr:hypothetical protein [Mycoplasma elephantis]